MLHRFYEWLMKVEEIKFKFQLWEEKNVSFNYKDQIGLSHTKHVISKDVAALKEAKNNNLYDGIIQVGGKLRPFRNPQLACPAMSVGQTNNAHRFPGGCCLQCCLLRLRVFYGQVHRSLLVSSGAIGVNIGTIFWRTGNRLPTPRLCLTRVMVN